MEQHEATTLGTRIQISKVILLKWNNKMLVCWILLKTGNTEDKKNFHWQLKNEEYGRSWAFYSMTQPSPNMTV